MVIVSVSYRSVASVVSTIRIRLPASISCCRNYSTLLKHRQKSGSLARTTTRQGHISSVFVYPTLFGQRQRHFASSANASEKDPYRLLGVDRNASADEIKKAYRREALKWHPDRHPNEERKEAEARFGAIANAYETLSDPAKKQQFDHGGQAGGFSSGPGGFSSGFHQGGFHSQADAERLFREVFGGQSMDGIFRELFGSGPPSPGQQTLQVGTEVQVLPDRQSVLAACRKSGIDQTNDSLRVRSLGKHGRIIKTDSKDQSVKIKIIGVGDVWFGAAGVRAVGGADFPGHSQFFEGFGNFGAFGGDGLSGGGGGVVQMRQEIFTYPNGQRVVRVTRTVRGPDGSLREEVSESPLQ